MVPNFTLFTQNASLQFLSALRSSSSSSSHFPTLHPCCWINIRTLLQIKPQSWCFYHTPPVDEGYYLMQISHDIFGAWKSHSHATTGWTLLHLRHVGSRVWKVTQASGTAEVSFSKMLNPWSLTLLFLMSFWKALCLFCIMLNTPGTVTSIKLYMPIACKVLCGDQQIKIHTMSNRFRNPWFKVVYIHAIHFSGGGTSMRKCRVGYLVQSGLKVTIAV